MKNILKIILSLVYIAIIYLYFNLEMFRVLLHSELEKSTYIIFGGVLLLILYLIYKAFSLLINGIGLKNIKKIVMGIIMLFFITIFFYVITRTISDSFSIDNCPSELYGTCD